MRKLVCDSCGGHIDQSTLICNHCGVAYRLDEYEMPIRVMEYSTRVETLSGCVRVPAYLVRDEKDAKDIMEMSLHKMAEQMAIKIMPLIELHHEFEPRTCEYVTYGRLKVANPHTTTPLSSYREVSR